MDDTGRWTGWRGDLLLAAFTLVVTAASIAANEQGADDRDPDRTAYAIAVAVSALLLARRQHPRVVLALSVVMTFVYFALGYPPITLALPVAAALYSVGEAGLWRFGAAVSAVMIALASTFRLLIGHRAGSVLLAGVPTLVALMGGAVALGYAVHTRRRLRDEELRSALAEAAQARRAAEARVEEERLLLARDLHDVLAHTVSVMAIHSDVAIEALDDGDQQAARRSLVEIRGQCASSIAELRSTLQVLRGAGVRTPVVSIADIETLVEAARRAGLEARLDVEGDVHDVHLPARSTAFRVVQEGITNTLKHSGASQIEVALRRTGSALQVEVADDGRGPQAPACTAGHGLRGLQERVELVGGATSVGARDPHGFVLHATIPV